MQDASIRESLTQKQWDRIFYGCPAAWAGTTLNPILTAAS